MQVGPYHAAGYRMKVRDAVRPNFHHRNTCETAIQVHICRVIERKDLEIRRAKLLTYAGQRGL